MKDDFDGTPRTSHCPAGLPAAVARETTSLMSVWPAMTTMFHGYGRTTVTAP